MLPRLWDRRRTTSGDETRDHDHQGEPGECRGQPPSLEHDEEQGTDNSELDQRT